MKKVSLLLSLVFLVAFVFNASAQTEERRGWSPQAKGAVIGAATGGAAGAIIHKRNRVVGGVVGGVVGAGAGYGVGKIIDNKQKKRQAEEAARVAAANRAAERAAASRSVASRSTTRRSSVAKKSVAPAREEVMAAPAMAYNSYNGSQDPIMGMALLPNADYGDPTKPYYTSEYRRKSW